jgi:hypothetical protein
MLERSDQPHDFVAISANLSSDKTDAHGLSDVVLRYVVQRMHYIADACM